MTVSLDLRIPGLLEAKLDFPGTGVTAIIGASGAGKTLLLRAIAGLEPADGSVRIGGMVWQDGATRLPPHRRRLGYVFQKPGLLSHLSVRGNLRFALDRRTHRPEAAAPTLEEIVDLLDLGALLERGTDRLSGGEAQRVAIARALLTAPELLLMDEPVSALDAAARQEVLARLVSLRRHLKSPMLYVTHDLDEVARIADHVAVLEQGQIVASGPVRDLLTRLDLPVSHRADAEALLFGTVQSYDSELRIAAIGSTAGLVHAVTDQLETGAPVRVRVRARDVSIALAPAGETSILNILPLTVVALDGRHPDRVVVKLSAGDEAVLAHVSHLSARRLLLAEGRQVFAQFKSVAVLA